jgi:hypothetical protein
MRNLKYSTADVDLAEVSSWLLARNMTMNNHAWMGQTAATSSREVEELGLKEVIGQKVGRQ